MSFVSAALLAPLAVAVAAPFPVDARGEPGFALAVTVEDSTSFLERLAGEWTVVA
jgi:hypothetical protein